MASSTITLTAADGFMSSAYVSEPSGTAKGALVVLQEIFGVNSHVRGVADGYAAAGYLAIAPSTFDRVERDVQLGYTPNDITQGSRLKAAVEALPAPGVLQDIQAAVDYAARAGKVGIVGYCWGGYIAWMSAARVAGFACAVPYYGGGMLEAIGEKPRCPVMAHFGEKDHAIPIDGVRQWAAAHPEVETHVYAANHGFNCDQRGSYDAPAAKLARERTLAFLHKHVG